MYGRNYSAALSLFGGGSVKPPAPQNCSYDRCVKRVSRFCNGEMDQDRA